ncbi:MAG: hypothetical protein NTV86_19405 [Planctomycetota bacterium]|nr:hypothetical protein [Planctomycetota bacterium]
MQGSGQETAGGKGFDMREWLQPKRLTLAMWDHAYLTRHVAGDAFEDYDKVLDEAAERGYNTLRLDPLPHVIDLSRPEVVYRQADTKRPYLPWSRPGGFEGPAGAWLIEMVEKLRARKLNYTLSAWWPTGIEPAVSEPRTLADAAELWASMLRQWKKRFGFEGLAYVDLNNEFPCFLADQWEEMEKRSGPMHSPAWQQLATAVINMAMDRMRDEFPELLFTVSLHGDLPHCGMPVELDCLDIHFYSDADPRWTKRTRFDRYLPDLFTKTDWRKDFSSRCGSARAAAGMYRARQRAKAEAFAQWGRRRGMPLTASGGWSSQYYIDSPEMDWTWLLEWAEWSVEDAIDLGLWGWSPHNYVQPQFANWKDIGWHQELTARFLQG